MLYYIPTLNDEILLEHQDVALPCAKVIQLLQIIYLLDKRYKIEKIISYNNEDYEDIIKQITNNYRLELFNHEIDGNIGYFHITFEKELIHDSEDVIYDKYCPFAISLIIDGNIDIEIYNDLIKLNNKNYFLL